MLKTLFFVLMTCVLSESASLNEKVSNYFESDVFKAFQKDWQIHRKSFENAILLALKDNFGRKNMNVYMRPSVDSLRISNGFFTSDNIVDLLLLELTLTGLPHLIMPEASFALASNVLRIEAGLSKMIAVTAYLLFRNESDILHAEGEDTYKHSPFTFEEVEVLGQLAIVADDCTLVGYAIAKLSGQSVTLGHDTFQVRDCKFSVEISPFRYSYIDGQLPVIAPYFSKSQSKQLESLLSKPIREELMPKLQAAIFSYINTSLIFGDHLVKFREYQDNLFKMVSKNITELVRQLNNLTIHLNEETAELESERTSRNFSYNGQFHWDNVLLHKVNLYGLDTLYSSHTGGPFKLQSPLIAEALRFNSIIVKGSILFENNTVKGEHDFVADIMDTTVNVEFDLKTSETSFKVFNWRKIEFSIIELEKYSRDRRTASAFINGYLLNKLPDVLNQHLTRMFLQYINSAAPVSSVHKLKNKDLYCDQEVISKPVLGQWYG